MTLLTEKITPPPTIAVTDEEADRKLADDLAQDDRWVKNLIDGLARSNWCGEAALID